LELGDAQRLASALPRVVSVLQYLRARPTPTHVGKLKLNKTPNLNTLSINAPLSTC